MLVIKGYSGKSLAVADYIKNLGADKVLVVDREAMNLNHILHDVGDTEVYCIRVYGEEENLDTFISNFKKTLNQDDHNFEHVIFYMNTVEANISKFKAIENELGIKAVLTVQTPDSENRKPREVEKVTV